MDRTPSPPAICRSSASGGRSLRAVRGEIYHIHFWTSDLAGARLESGPDYRAAHQGRVIAICLREDLAFGPVAFDVGQHSEIAAACRNICGVEMPDIDDCPATTRFLDFFGRDLAREQCLRIHAAGGAERECDLPRPAEKIERGVLDQDGGAGRNVPANPFRGQLTGVGVAFGRTGVAGGESGRQQGEDRGPLRDAGGEPALPDESPAPNGALPLR